MTHPAAELEMLIEAVRLMAADGPLDAKKIGNVRRAFRAFEAARARPMSSAPPPPSAPSAPFRRIRVREEVREE